MPKSRPPARAPLSRERVVLAGVRLADESGIDSLSMRKLGVELGVEAMSLYNHVANKEDLLDGMVDAVFSEVVLPTGPWREAMRDRAASMREALARHPWAVGRMESRSSPGPATLRHHDAVIGCLLDAGLSLKLTAHAYALLDSYIYGFALQERGLPFRTPDEVAALAETIMASFPRDAYPHLAEFTIQHVLQPGYSFAAEFDFGLELLLDGLAAKLAQEQTPRRRRPRGD